MRERGEIEYDGHRSIVTPFMREMLETNRAQMGNSIPCGALDDVIDEEIEHLRLPKAITGEGEFFLLRARGESMIKPVLMTVTSFSYASKRRLSKEISFFPL